MPITPLHFGVLAPVNHWFPGKVSVISFTLANLWMDGNAILYFVFGVDKTELHSPMTHSFLAALVLSSVVAMFGCRSGKWILGAYYGGITHVSLDMLVHSEMQPFYPIHWNPVHVGYMGPISLVLVPLLIWFIVGNVSSARDWVQKHLRVF